MKSNGGLEPLVALIKNNENHGNKVEILQLSTLCKSVIVQ